MTPDGEPLRDALGDVEHAVDPEADEQLVLLRLEVDVARAVLGRLEDDRVDEPDDRPLRDAVLGLEVVGLVLDRLRRDRRRRTSAFMAPSARVEPAHLDHDVLLRRDGELDRLALREPQLVDRRGRRRGR